MPFEIPLDPVALQRPRGRAESQNGRQGIERRATAAISGSLESASVDDVGDLTSPDFISIIAQALKFNIPLVELDTPTGVRPLEGTQKNMYRSFTLGMGVSCVLEMHELRKGELESL